MAVINNNRKISRLNSGIEIYFEYLKDLNCSYKKIISTSCIKNPIKLKKEYFFFIQNINKVIPWIYIGKDNQLKLSLNDAIMCYSNSFAFLLKDMETIFNNNIGLINSFRNIRNGIEHAPHEIIIDEMSSGSNISRIVFVREKESYELKSIEVKKLLIELNSEFVKMVNYVEKNINYYPSDLKKSYTYGYLKRFKNKMIGDYNEE